MANTFRAPTTDQLLLQLQDALAALQTPAHVTARDLRAKAAPELKTWLETATARRALGRLLRMLGYEVCRNPHDTRGRWFIDGKQVAVYRFEG